MTLRNGFGIVSCSSSPPGRTAPTTCRRKTIRRPDLYRVLRDATARVGVPITYGRRLVEVDRLPDGRVRARFADGSEATGDLLIGADGLRSCNLDAYIDPAARAARYTGLLNVGGYARGLDLGLTAGCPRLLLRAPVLPRPRDEPSRRCLVVHQPAEP